MSLKMIRASLLTIALICTITLPTGIAFGGEFYHRGDANADGWCNMADYLWWLNTFRGELYAPAIVPRALMPIAMAQVDVSDLVRLYNFLTTAISEPGGFCDCPVMTCDQTEKAFLYLQPISDSDTMTASFDVYVGASVNISTLNFSFEYDPSSIASISASGVAPANVYTNDRVQASGKHVIGILFIPGNDGAYPLEEPGTPIIHLTFNRVQGGIDDKIAVVEDPIFGPPRLYYGYEGESKGCKSIMPYAPSIPGDANASGNVNGLDVTYLVSWLKGNISFPPVERSFWSVQVKWEY